MNTAKTLRILREMAGLRQRELAERVKVSENYLSLVENGKREPSLKFLQKVAEEFGIPTSVLVWDELNADEISDPDLKQIAEKINDLYWSIIRRRLA